MENPIYQKAILKSETYCAHAEKCISEVEKKLTDWGFPEEIIPEVLEHLQKEKFIDQERYAIAFARDKFRFNKWGKIKISLALRQKNISSQTISSALNEIPEKEYTELLTELLLAKAKEIKRKESDPYKQKAKLFNFAQSRGFESDSIYSLI